jgi:hypothetical protein
MDKKVGVRKQIVVPGLDPGAKYVSRLSTRSALYTDLQILLEQGSECLSVEKYKSLVVEENCLARSTTSARVKLWRELKGRYRLDGYDPLFTAFLEEWHHCHSEQERGLTAYILFALNDRLIADLGTLWLFPYLRHAPVEARVDSVQGFIRQAVVSHPEIQKWSELTRKRLAQHYMASIRDFGLMSGKFKKVSVRPALYAAPIRLLVRALRLAGVTHPLELVQAPIFRLLVLETFEVIDALGELNRLGEVHFRMQGDVVELDLEAVAVA